MAFACYDNPFSARGLVTALRLRVGRCCSILLRAVQTGPGTFAVMASHISLQWVSWAALSLLSGASAFTGNRYASGPSPCMCLDSFSSFMTKANDAYREDIRLRLEKEAQVGGPTRQALAQIWKNLDSAGHDNEWYTTHATEKPCAVRHQQ
jgi:hypothetical protein